MNTYIKIALKLAEQAFYENEVPVGAIIVDSNNKIIATGKNEVEKTNLSFFHAEFIAVKLACNLLQTRYLNECSIYTNLEPCTFCASLLANVRIKQIFFSLEDKKNGGIYNGAKIFNSSLHKPDIYEGFLEDESRNLMQKFFIKIRDNKKTQK